MFHGDDAAASTQGGLADRGELAFVAMERTRMPMVVTDPRQPDNPIVLANRAFLELTGYSADEVVGRNCRFLQGPGTDPAAVDEIRTSVREGRELTIELLNYAKSGLSFWNQLMLSPVHDDQGALIYFFASQMDVTDRRKAQDLERAEHRLLREVDHRAKNVLALVQGIVRLSRAEDAKTYSAAVQGRVDALARAHAILAENHWRDLPLRRLVQAEAEPFGARRVSLHGPDLTVAPSQVQPLALILHELLSNAARHGALSQAGGRVAIGWERAGDELIVAWREAGGPAPADDRQRGFGMTMIDAIIRRQLNGRSAFHWKSEGLEGHVTLPERVAA